MPLRSAGTSATPARSESRGEANTFGPILEAARAYATVGEIAQAMKTVFGTWEETSVL